MNKYYFAYNLHRGDKHLKQYIIDRLLEMNLAHDLDDTEKENVKNILLMRVENEDLQLYRENKDINKALDKYSKNNAPQITIYKVLRSGFIISTQLNIDQLLAIFTELGILGTYINGQDPYLLCKFTEITTNTNQ